MFGSSSPFGALRTSLFGSSSSPSFDGSSTPAFGSSSSPVFGESSAPTFSFGYAPSFGQSTPALGSSPFGATPSPFGNQSSPFGVQTSTPTFVSPGFGQSSFGSQTGGSRVAPYTPTTESDVSGTQPAGKLESISAMPIYKDKCHEELRWEDYQRGDKGSSSCLACVHLVDQVLLRSALVLRCLLGVLHLEQHPLLLEIRASFSTQTPTTFGGLGFGQSFFESQIGGSRVAPYTPTTEFDVSGKQPAVEIESISAMPVYMDKSHEQLRWEDYQRGDKAFGGFGSTTNQVSLFGSPFQQTQTAFGSNMLGSSSPFGALSTSLFGASSYPSFDGSSTTAFGSSSSPAFGELSASIFSFGSAPSFGQSTPAFGVTPSPFENSSSPFGAQTSTHTFGSPGLGQSSFGSQTGGCRVAPYAPTIESDVSGTQPAGKLESISAMPFYKDKSHEELKWEDYQRGDKGGPNPAAQPGEISFPTLTQSNPFGQTSAFGQHAANPFSSTSSSNPLAPNTQAFGSPGFGSSSTSLFSSPFSSSSSSPFGSTSSAPSLFGAPTTVSGFGSSTSPSIFSGGSALAFSSSSSIFGSSMMGSTSSFGTGLAFGGTQSSGLFSSTPSIGQTLSPFGQSTGFQQNTPVFGSGLFSTASTGFGGSLFSSSTPSFGQSTPSLSTPFQQSVPAQTPSTFSFGNFGPTQTASSGGSSSFPNTLNQETLGQRHFYFLF